LLKRRLRQERVRLTAASSGQTTPTTEPEGLQFLAAVAHHEPWGGCDLAPPSGETWLSATEVKSGGVKPMFDLPAVTPHYVASPPLVWQPPAHIAYTPTEVVHILMSAMPEHYED